MAGGTGNDPSDAFVEIAGEPTLAKTTGIPPIRVPLPLESEMRSSFFWFIAFTLFGLFGVLVIFLAVVPVIEGKGGVTGVLVSALLTVFGAILFGNTLLFYRDIARRLRPVVVTAKGVLDRRAIDAPLTWADIERASAIVYRGDIIGVLLSLRRPLKARRNPFRFGAGLYFFRRRADELVIPLAFCRNRRTIALTIGVLVKRNGGASDL